MALDLTYYTNKESNQEWPLTFHTNKEISLEYSLQSISHCILIRIDLWGTVKPVSGCNFGYGH